MDTRKANEAFNEARRHFEGKRYDQALTLLDTLDAAFPSNRRLMLARARTLDKLGRYDDARRLCELLLQVHGYEKVRPLYEHLCARKVSLEIPASLTDTSPTTGLENWSAGDTEVRKRPQEAPVKKRFSLPLKRLILLIAIGGGLYWLQAPHWVSATIGGVFVTLLFVIPWLIGRLLHRLFSVPFKMKGKALAGAQATVHDVYPGRKPARKDDEEDEEEDRSKEPVEYYWIDVTITPGPPQGRFTHWEPGELAFLPRGKRFKTLDDHEHCYTVCDVRIVAGGGERNGEGNDGEDQEDEGMKYAGPLRVKLLAGLPVNYEEFEFVYYLERFGHIRLPD
ncbi:MAG: tetratricopeptide repeat protein [Candidatus Hydrogenedentes bacterium]|nr:tetratricopeptide repeat protein [Candidatus Hydrogenedentota bacterium]